MLLFYVLITLIFYNTTASCVVQWSSSRFHRKLRARFRKSAWELSAISAGYLFVCCFSGPSLTCDRSGFDMRIMMRSLDHIPIHVPIVFRCWLLTTKMPEMLQAAESLCKILSIKFCTSKVLSNIRTNCSKWQKCWKLSSSILRTYYYWLICKHYCVNGWI